MSSPFFRLFTVCRGNKTAPHPSSGTIILRAKPEQHLIINCIRCMGRHPVWFTKINVIPVDEHILPENQNGSTGAWNHHNYYDRQTLFLIEGHDLATTPHVNLLSGNLNIHKNNNIILQWAYNAPGEGWDSGLEITGIYL